MKKSWIIGCLILCQISLIAQSQKFSTPNLKSIAQNIINISSTYYYPALYQRYLNGDLSLNTQQRQHLYYGYIFSPDFTPYYSYKSIDSVALLIYYKKYNDADLYQYLSDCDSLLNLAPFDLKLLFHKSQLLTLLELNSDLKINRQKILTILETILSTGDGITTQNPLYVTTLEDEFQFVKAMGYTYNKDHLISKKGLDYLGVKTNSNAIDGFYFNLVNTLIERDRILKKFK